MKQDQKGLLQYVANMKQIMICFVSATVESCFGAKISCFIEQVHHMIYAQISFPLFHGSVFLGQSCQPLHMHIPCIRTTSPTLLCHTVATYLSVPLYMLTVFFDAVDSEMFEKLKSILPGMEKSPKYNLVDPYVAVSFAGHSQHTSTVHENRNPVWDTKLNLAVRVGAL